MTEHGWTLIWLSQRQVIKSGALVRHGERSALQGQGPTPGETLEERGLNIHCRQAACLETSSGNAGRCVKTQLAGPSLEKKVYTYCTRGGRCDCSIFL